MSKGMAILELLAVLPFVSPAISLPGENVPAEAIVRQAHEISHYSGNDMKARVLMRLINKDGKERIREMTMLRLNSEEPGEQKYFLYFHRPGDVRDMTFMVWKHPEGDDERWLFIPAIKLVRRIAANDKRSSFVGSDFSYEDISGREVEEDTHSLVREETVEGRAAFVIRSVPKDEKGAEFSYKLSWIDKENFVLWREEYYDRRDELYKTFTADEVRQVQDYWTAVKRTMKNMQNGHRTEVTFRAIDYDVGLEDGLFSERYLRNPPARWVR
ncbi:MAG: outer membrane lipoprotein-sorting protein [Acidobacteriota bacterium]